MAALDQRLHHTLDHYALISKKRVEGGISANPLVSVGGMRFWYGEQFHGLDALDSGGRRPQL